MTGEITPKKITSWNNYISARPILHLKAELGLLLSPTPLISIYQTIILSKGDSQLCMEKCVCVCVGSEHSLHFLYAGMSEIMTVLFLSFPAANRSLSSGPQVKKHGACKRLMRTTVPDGKVTGNNRVYFKKKSYRQKRSYNRAVCIMPVASHC